MEYDWFQVNFLGCFLNLDMDVKKGLNQRQYSLSEPSVTPRVLHHWYQTGIISDRRSDGKGWSKFSFTELVWIKLIIRLREFGLSLYKIKIAKEDVSKYAAEDVGSMFPLLDFYLLYARSYKHSVSLKIFEDGHLLLGRETELQNAQFYQFNGKDFLTLSLNQVVKEVIRKVSATHLLDPREEVQAQLQAIFSSDALQTKTISFEGRTQKVNPTFLMD
jgi:DNA-binding transcriptional MerR regulator